MKKTRTIRVFHQVSKQANNTQERKSHLENFAVGFFISTELRARVSYFLIAALKSWVSKEEESTTS
jgi:hypothetical protein